MTRLVAAVMAVVTAGFVLGLPVIPPPAGFGTCDDNATLIWAEAGDVRVEQCTNIIR